MLPACSMQDFGSRLPEEAASLQQAYWPSKARKEMRRGAAKSAAPVFCYHPRPSGDRGARRRPGAPAVCRSRPSAPLQRAPHKSKNQNNRDQVFLFSCYNGRRRLKKEPCGASSPVKLPNAERAVVDIDKLRNYCLNPEHRRGCHKARVFAASLGLTIEHAEDLRDALLAAARDEDAAPAEHDEYGRRYVVDFIASGPSGQAMVRSSWIIRRGEDFPRLTSCYVL